MANCNNGSCQIYPKRQIMKWYYYVIALLLAIILIEHCTRPTPCDKRLVMHTDLIKIDSNIVTTQIKVDTLLATTKKISTKVKKLPKLGVLLPSCIGDSITISKLHYDSTRTLCLLKERYLDSMTVYSDSLSILILKERVLHEQIDSLNQIYINNQASTIDSLDSSNKKYIRGFKHGFVLGAIIGFIVPKK